MGKSTGIYSLCRQKKCLTATARCCIGFRFWLSSRIVLLCGFGRCALRDWACSEWTRPCRDWWLDSWQVMLYDDCKQLLECRTFKMKLFVPVRHWRSMLIWLMLESLKEGKSLSMILIFTAEQRKFLSEQLRFTETISSKYLVAPVLCVLTYLFFLMLLSLMIWNLTTHTRTFAMLWLSACVVV